MIARGLGDWPLWAWVALVAVVAVVALAIVAAVATRQTRPEILPRLRLPHVIGLLGWPLIDRGREGVPRVTAGYRGGPDSEVRDGIVDVEAGAAGAIDWPDWNAPAGRGR